MFHRPLPYSTVAGIFFGGGGRVGRARPRRGGPGEKTLKIFEVFIPENAANASNFKKWGTHLLLLFFSPSLHNYWGGGGGGGGDGASRPLPLLWHCFGLIYTVDTETDLRLPGIVSSEAFTMITTNPACCADSADTIQPPPPQS